MEGIHNQGRDFAVGAKPRRPQRQIEPWWGH